jgi:hypothetical protein
MSIARRNLDTGEDGHCRPLGSLYRRLREIHAIVVRDRQDLDVVAEGRLNVFVKLGCRIRIGVLVRVNVQVGAHETRTRTSVPCR